MSNLSKALVLDGVIGSSHIDSSGEILDIEGCDISSLQDGSAVLNWEHKGDSPGDILGRIIYAKKILGPEDCSDLREKFYWEQEKVPFIYGKAELFDSDGHAGAMAAAAIIRHYHKRKLPIQVRFSIEGQTLERKGNVLKRSVARRVAATIKPCNRSAYSGVLDDRGSEVVKPDGVLVKGKFYETVPLIEDPIQQLYRLSDELKEMIALEKAITAGSYNVAPSNLSGGAALQREQVGSAYDTLKSQVLAAFRDWDRVEPIRKFLKSRLPDASDEYIDRFASLVDDYQVKKSEQLFFDLDKAIGSQVPETVDDNEKVPNNEFIPAKKLHIKDFFRLTFPNKDDSIIIGVKDNKLVMANGAVVAPQYSEFILAAIKQGDLNLEPIEVYDDKEDLELEISDDAQPEGKAIKPEED